MTLLAIHCPACGKRLTTEKGGDDSQPLQQGNLSIICLQCPDCDTPSTTVLDMDRLQKGGASKGESKAILENAGGRKA